MSKVMLVEDDNNLREIYEARLLAEGYEIVSARDGEEALALAVKERPDLIIADVMMPKISGFDMLDILRSTPETKSTKVIMMTALSQAEDKARAAQLGADRYLVKSQVTLEDVAKVAREVLEGDSPSAAPPADPTPPPSDPTPPPVDPAPPGPVDPPAMPPVDPPAAPPADPTPPPSDPTPPPVNPAPQPAVVAAPATTMATPAMGQTTAQETATVTAQINAFAGEGVPAGQADSPAPASALTANQSDEQPSGAPMPEPSAAANPRVTVAGPSEPAKVGSHSKIIQPINDLTQKGNNLDELVKQEEVKEQMANVAQQILQKKAIEAAAATPGLQPPIPTPAAPNPSMPATVIDPNAIAL
jgi:CheY-like chemotaxis protein